MADKDERKRLNYFNGLFLQAEDFQAEQDYHLEQQRRHNRLLHTPGIAGENSLTVTARVGETVITVSPGTAIDREGRQLVVLSEDQNRENIPVGTSTTPKRVLLVISYPPEPVPTSDPAPVGSGDTRVFERPILEVIPENDTKANQPTTYIQLARLSIGPTGIDAAPDLSVRLTAGVRAAGALVSVNGVSNPGGNVDLVAGGAIALTPNNTTKQITISENHSTKTDNPHKVTAAQVKALSTESGGTVNGVVNLVPSAGPVSMSILRGVPVNTPAPANNAAAFFYNTPPSVAQPPTYGLVSRITPSPTSGLGAGITLRSAAVAGIADAADVHGLYAFARQGTHALYVEGTARIPTVVNGHIVDTFVNASGQRLRTGDLVRLKGTPISRFQGPSNKIPVAEVTLADKEDDTLVMGIVDCEAIPDPDTPDTRVNPEDPTFIENGSELFLVTLGAFAHCKVDATEAPIEVGDLLTSSANPGHAKKATNPKLGSIIGKALEPLKEGTGYIAVFVNIQ